MKGYGKFKNPNMEKYFARKKNSAGPHDPKNAKQQALEKAWKEQDLFECPPEEVFDVGEQVRIVNEKGLYHGDQGRIVMRRNDFGDMSYGVIFDWDVNMCAVYFAGKDLERA